VIDSEGLERKALAGFDHEMYEVIVIDPIM
jgi:hypothetical protein